MIEKIKAFFAIQFKRRLRPAVPIPGVIWFTGLSGAGKTTIAKQLITRLQSQGHSVELLDGDLIRNIFPDLGFTPSERIAHIKSVGHLASRLEGNGVFVIGALISPFEEARQFVRGLCKNYLEVYISTPLEECERRDVKGLYAKARRGELANFTGIDSSYEIPKNPELTINTVGKTPQESTSEVFEFVVNRQRILRKKNKLFFPLLLLILLFSAALRFYRLGQASYWIDEMVSLHFAHSANSKSILWDNNPFLYHLLLKLWVKLGGMSEIWTRLLSVLISVGTTGLLYYFGFYLRGLSGAVVISLIYAVCPLSINYAQETRMYSLFEFAMCLQMIYFIKLRNNVHTLKKFTLATCLLCLTHYLAIVPITIEAGFLLFDKTFESNRKKKILVSLITGLLLLATSFKIFFGWSFLEWQKLRFQVDTGSRWPAEILWNLMNRSWISGSAIALLTIYFLYSLKPKRQAIGDSIFFILFVALSLELFQIGVFITERGIFVPRYLIFIMPFFISWMGVTWLALWQGTRNEKRFSILLMALFSVGVGTNLPEVYISQKPPWREAARIIGSYPGNIVLTTKPVSIQTPYFEEAKIPVERWTPYLHGNEIIQKHLKDFKNVWILENYWGTRQYISEIKSDLLDMKLQVTDFSIKNKTSEPLLILRIRKAELP